MVKAFRGDKQLIIDVEQYFHCCGFNRLSDRAVPPCKYYTPCYESVKESLINNWSCWFFIRNIRGNLFIYIISVYFFFTNSLFVYFWLLY